MDGERSRLPTVSCERWGGKVYPDVDIEGDFDEQRVMIIRMDTTPAIPIYSFIHSCIPLPS